MYQILLKLFILGGKELQSTEGTNQGDHIAMGIYATGVFPKKAKNLGFVKNFKGSGKLQELWSQWYSIVSHGHAININSHI